MPMSTRAGPAWPSKIAASGEVTRDPMQSTELGLGPALFVSGWN